MVFLDTFSIKLMIAGFLSLPIGLLVDFLFGGTTKAKGIALGTILFCTLLIFRLLDKVDKQ